MESPYSQPPWAAPKRLTLENIDYREHILLGQNNGSKYLFEPLLEKSSIFQAKISLALQKGGNRSIICENYFLSFHTQKVEKMACG